jgi:DNA-binding CsgD family transcriptional regulator
MHVVATVELVGRERELEAGRRFVAAVPDGAARLLVRGEAGVGKTVLWREIAREAADAGQRVLLSRCFHADMPLGFVTLADLLEDVVGEVADELPPAQRAALDVALRRATPDAGAPDALTISRGVLSVLRLLAAAGPVVLAVDDVQWVDPASARVLAFTLRRLQREQVGVLATQRHGDDEKDPLVLAALAEGRLERVELGALSVGALQHVVRARVGTSLPRATLVRLHEACGGNPMFALEFARSLPDPAPAGALPMPASLRALVRDRLAALPAALRPLLELVAALGQPTLELLERAHGSPVDEQLAAAISAGALVADEGGDVRFAHPLLASAVYADAGPARRRELHRAAADAIADDEERARHLALASAGPDEELALLLDRAAARAHGRGAPDAAAELAERAQRLTPPELKPDRYRRAVRAAGYLVEAGDERGARALLDPLLEGDVPAATRADALLVRASAEWNDRPLLLELLRQALECAHDDPRLRCEALIRYAWHAGHVSGDEFAAERWAREALALAERAGDPGLIEQAAALVLWTAAVRAVPAGDVPPEQAAGGARTPPWGLPRRAVLGTQLLWRGRLAEARELLAAELERASRQGSEIRLATLHQNLAELELRAGNWELARRYAEDGFQIMREVGGNGEMLLRFARGRVAAHQGRVEEARADLSAALTRAESQHDVVNVFRNRFSLGFLDLSRGDPEHAWQSLAGLPELAERIGLGEPAAGPFLPEAVEALVALGRLDEAEPLVVRLEQRARALDHLWATPAAARCCGLLLLGRGELEGAVEALESSVAGFERIGFPFDRARSLLALGDALRRAGRRTLAAARLEEARALFEQLGARLWLERTATEFRRAAPRPRRDRGLTAAEARVAQLVAAGATNKEVAARLFTTVGTVETHLTRIYRKLDVRSRSELARKVARGELELSEPAED